LTGNFERELEKSPTKLQAASKALFKFVMSREGYLPRLILAGGGIDPFGGKIHPSQWGTKMSEVAIPLPIASRQYFQAVKSLLGVGTVLESKPGETQKQIMQSFGAKTATAKTANQRVRSWMMELLKESTDPKDMDRAARMMDESYAPSAYSGLRNSLAAKNWPAAREEFEKLLETKKRADIYKAINPKTATGKWKPIFGTSPALDAKLRRKMTDDQLSVYRSALTERDEIFRRLKRIYIEP
jgi:hypothetical protein